MIKYTKKCKKEGEPYYDISFVYPLLQTQGEKDAFIDGYAQDYEVCESKINYYDILSKFTCI